MKLLVNGKLAASKGRRDTGGKRQGWKGREGGKEKRIIEIRKAEEEDRETKRKGRQRRG